MDYFYDVVMKLKAEDILSNLNKWRYVYAICFGAMIIAIIFFIGRRFCHRRKSNKKSKQQKKRATEKKRQTESVIPNPTPGVSERDPMNDQLIRKRNNDADMKTARKVVNKKTSEVSRPSKSSEDSSSDQVDDKWITVENSKKALKTVPNETKPAKIDNTNTQLGSKKKEQNKTKKVSKKPTKPTPESQIKEEPVENTVKPQQQSTNDSEEEWQEVRFSRKGGKYRKE